MFEVFFRPIEKENVFYYQSKDFKKKIKNNLPSNLNDRILYLLCCYKWLSLDKDPLKKLTKHPKIMNFERKKLINYQFLLYATTFVMGIPCLIDNSIKIKSVGLVLIGIALLITYNNDFLNKVIFYRKSDYDKYLELDINKKEVKKELLKYNIKV